MITRNFCYIAWCYIKGYINSHIIILIRWHVLEKHLHGQYRQPATFSKGFYPTSVLVVHLQGYCLRTNHSEIASVKHKQKNQTNNFKNSASKQIKFNIQETGTGVEKNNHQNKYVFQSQSNTNKMFFVKAERKLTQSSKASFTREMKSTILKGATFVIGLTGLQQQKEPITSKSGLRNFN